MPAIYHPGLIQIVPQYDIGAPHLAANVLHYESTSGTAPTTAELTATQSMFNTWWGLVWGGLAPTNTYYRGCIVTDMSSNTGLQVRNDTFTPVAGTKTGGGLSDGTAVLISLKTAVRYKGGHGRIYVPGIAMASTQGDGRTLDSGVQSGTDSALVQLATHMNSVSIGGVAGLQLVVWHKHLSSAPNTIENVIVSTTQTVLATQRRRLRKVARHRRRLA